MLSSSLLMSTLSEDMNQRAVVMMSHQFAFLLQLVAIVLHIRWLSGFQALHPACLIWRFRTLLGGRSWRTPRGAQEQHRPRCQGPREKLDRLPRSHFAQARRGHLRGGAVPLVSPVVRFPLRGLLVLARRRQARLGPTARRQPRVFPWFHRGSLWRPSLRTVHRSIRV